MPRPAAAAAVDVPALDRGRRHAAGPAPIAAGHRALQTPDTLRARSWSGGRRTVTLLSNHLSHSPSGGAAGPLVSPSFSGHGFIRASPSATSASPPRFSPPALDLRNSLPTIISQSNLAGVANGTVAPDTGNDDARLSRLVSLPRSPSDDGSIRGSAHCTEQPWASSSDRASPVPLEEHHRWSSGEAAPDPQRPQVVDQSLEAPLLLRPSQSADDPERNHQANDSALEKTGQSAPPAEGGGLFKCLIFGAINAIVAVPCMIAYAAIIFADPFFGPYKDQLVKLVLFSSLIHQACFSAKSSLPFAIGQVQDAGLIFLSQMATSLVAKCKEADLPDEEIITTSLVGLACSTAALGAALWLTGWLQLADAVQYLPLPVIGGYLAFIGLYCLEAALSLMTGAPQKTPQFCAFSHQKRSFCQDRLGANVRKR
jgi:hypothetical protein